MPNVHPALATFAMHPVRLSVIGIVVQLCLYVARAEADIATDRVDHPEHIDAVIHLNFDTPAPFVVKRVGNPPSRNVWDFKNGSTPAMTSPIDRSFIAAYIARIYRGAGVKLWVVTDRAWLKESPDETIYFAEKPPSEIAINGLAELDRFNARDNGKIIVFRNARSAPEIAATAAHELGHAFGLIHHNASEQHIMYYESRAGRLAFLSDKHEAFQKEETHNPTFHLQEFVGGGASPDLEPGSWDRKPRDLGCPFFD